MLVKILKTLESPAEWKLIQCYLTQHFPNVFDHGTLFKKDILPFCRHWYPTELTLLQSWKLQTQL